MACDIKEVRVRNNDVKKMASVSNIVKIPISREGVDEIIADFISFDGDLFADDPNSHFAIAFGDWQSNEMPFVRIHSECLTGDVFNSKRCDCGEQLTESIVRASKENGLVLYLRQEGRGIGLYNKLLAYKLQDDGFNTFDANEKLGFPKDLRTFEVAAQMLSALNKQTIRLHTNNMEKVNQLIENGIQVEEVISTQVYCNFHNKNYLSAKKNIANHNLILKDFV